MALSGRTGKGRGILRDPINVNCAHKRHAFEIRILFEAIDYEMPLRFCLVLSRFFG